MHIVCTTIEAAAQVLGMLMHEQLQPLHDYTIYPVITPPPPNTFTPLQALSSALLSQIGALMDISIIYER